MKQAEYFHKSTNIIFDNTLLSIVTGILFIHLSFYTFMPFILEISLFLAALLTAFMIVVFATIMFKLSYLAFIYCYDWIKERLVWYDMNHYEYRNFGWKL